MRLWLVDHGIIIAKYDDVTWFKRNGETGVLEFQRGGEKINYWTGHFLLQP